MPTVIDVIIPAWNRAHIIGAAIESVLTQRLPAATKLNLAVVDDGSTDDLEGALREFGGQVTCIRHPLNQGAAAARNAGIAAARGEYVAFLDSDDAWLPDKLIRQTDFMRIHGYAATCTSFRLLRPDRTEIIAPGYQTGDLGLADLAWGCFVSPGSTLICRRDVYGTIGTYDVSLRRLEDWDWLLRFSGKHQLGFLSEPLARIDASPSPNPGEVLAALEQMELKHLSSLPAKERRHFRSAVELVRAAARRRQGRLIAAAIAMAKSFCIAPASNVALTTVMHNRFVRH